MVARIILPSYGGTASVWTTCELFFQAVLLLGYGYAHLSTRKLGVRRQPWLHLAIMAAALLTLPFVTRVAGGATGEGLPTLRLLVQLLMLVGLSFFAVSAGAPLIQRWFADTRDPHAKDPYFLYSASNLGSMVALLAYPLLVEPRLRLPQQTWLWAGGFGLLVALMATCAAAMARSPRPEAVASETTDEDVLVDSGAITKRMRLKWIALSAVPSSLLLGATAYISTNVAPIPLLWVVPLALYLLTFILVFKKRPFIGSRPLGRIAGMLIPAIIVMIVMEAFMPALAVVHLSVFFIVAWACHARLSESRPAASHLTEFYFWMSVGGVLGGAFNAIVAPVIFNTLFEYPLALIAAALLLPAYRPGTKASIADAYYPISVGVLTFAVATGMLRYEVPPSQMRTFLAVGLPAVLCFLAVDRPVRFGSSLAAMILVANATGIASAAKVILSERSFFGVHRVLVFGVHDRFHQLLHGNTLHGLQNMERQSEPLTYYHRTGPIGTVFTAFSGPTKKENVALVGLGVGSIAAYGEPGQRMTFYEIDPTVRNLATNPKLFTFVRNSKAKVDIVIGDARLQLAKAPDHSYGLIVLDAFSSDSIPVHLLTREAGAMYLRKLAPGGILAYHISNRYLELSGVLTAMARDLGLVAYLDEDAPSRDESDDGKTSSIWMILARQKEDLGPLQKNSNWSVRDLDPGDKAWTDDYSNVLSVLKQE